MKNEKEISDTDDNAALKRCRIELSESEHKFLLFSSQCTDQLAILSEDGRFKYIASLVESFLGYTEEDLLKITIFDLAQPDDLVHLSKVLNRTACNTDLATDSYTARLRHKNGKWHWFKMTFTNKCNDPLILGIVAKFWDITDQKVAEDQILQLNRLYAFTSQINKAVTHAKNEQSLLEHVCQIAIKIGKFKAAWIGILDSDTGNMDVIGHEGINTDACARFIADYFDNEEPFDQIQKSGNAIVCNLIETNLHLNDHSDTVCSGFDSFIILPLKKSGIVVGTFTLCAADQDFFTPEEIRLLEEATADISHELDSMERLRKKKKAVAILRKTEANLQAIVNSTSEGFVLTDVEGIILECNNNAKNAVYLYSQTELTIGKDLFDFVPADRAKDFKNFFIGALSGETISYDNSYGELWFNFTISPVYELKEVTGICLSFKDITERKLSEQKLIESELFNKDVLSSLSSHIAVITSDGTLVAVNKAWEDFAKANNPRDFSNVSVGSNYFDVCKNAIALDDDDALKTLAGILSVFSKDSETFQMEYPCHSPEEKRWFTLHVSPFGADYSKVVISHQNITERKIAENNLNNTSQELKKTLTELNKIVDSSLDVICTINTDGRFVNVSKASQEMWGYHPDELVGNPFINLVYKEDVEETSSAATEIFNGKHITLFENRYVHKNGNLISLLWSANFDEKLGLMYCVAKNVTEQKRLEKRIERERDQFYHMFLQAPTAVGLLKGPDHIFVMANPLYLKLTGKADVIGKSVAEVFPEVLDQGFVHVLNHVYQTGESHIGTEALVKIDIGKNGELTDFYINFIYQPYRNDDGIIDGIFFFMNDVSEQVIARQNIEKSERFFKGVIESSADMIILMNATGKRTYATPAVIKRFGYTMEESPDLNLTDVIHPEDLDVANAFFVKVLQNPLIPMATPILRALKKDGTHFWVEGTMTNFLCTDGINGVVTNFRDVTERKVAEDNLSHTLVELDAERNRLVTAQRVSKIGSWETDLKTFQLKWSDEMHRIYGTDPETFGASHNDFLSFVVPEDRERVDQAFLNSLDREGTNCIEHHIITTAGIKKCVEENWTISRNDKGIATIAVGTCQDITERKNAADKVLKSETKLKVAQLVAQVGSWEVDLVTKDHSWSDEFYRILGIDENVQPSENALLSSIHPEDRAMALTAMRASSELSTNSSFVFRYVDKNGDLGYASTEWRFAFDHNRRPIHIYGILRDLTKVKIAENERIRMISDLMQRNKDLEQFSYIISHNLRAPVANIMGLAEELSDQSYDVETKVILTEALSSDVKRLENVIADLNTILQTKREITELKEKVSLSELVADIKSSISDLIQMQGVYINTDFEEVDEINTIKSYIQSIFYNLITNSIKYRKPFGGSLIEIKSHIADGKLIITFKDNGSGVDLTKKGDQIFGLYKRFHANTEGKGMGLYMVKTQVETLGGTIAVESEVNVGTTFIIEFGYSA